MKKILALVLALVMTMSLATISSGAAFSDADDVRYTDAVNTLSALGVLGGYGDGTIRPAADVSRGAAAKMVAMVATGSNPTAIGYYKGTSSFADVPATHTFADAVAFCVARGIVAGYGDGNYGVADNVKGWAVAKMVLVAMGYDAAAYGMEGAGSALNTITLASQVGLFAGMKADFAATEAASREECAQIVYNALNKEGVVKAPVNNTGVVAFGGSDTCLLENYGIDVDLDAKETTKAAMAGNIGMVVENQDTGALYTKIGSTNYAVETGKELIGHMVMFVPNGAVDEYNVPCVFNVVDLSSVVELAANITSSTVKGEEKFHAAFGTDALVATSRTDFDNYTKQTGMLTSNFSSDAHTANAGTYVIYDGKVVSYQTVASDVVVLDVEASSALNYTKGYYTVTDKTPNPDVVYVNVEATATNCYDKIVSDVAVDWLGMLSATSLSEKAVYIGTPCGSKLAIEPVKTVEGKITQISTVNGTYDDGSVYIDGVKYGYQLSDTAAAAALDASVIDESNLPGFTATYKFYLDEFGQVFAYAALTAEDTNSYELGYVMGTTAQTTGMDAFGNSVETYYIQYYTLDGAVKQATYAAKDGKSVVGYVVNASSEVIYNDSSDDTADADIAAAGWYLIANVNDGVAVKSLNSSTYTNGYKLDSVTVSSNKVLAATTTTLDTNDIITSGTTFLYSTASSASAANTAATVKTGAHVNTIAASTVVNTVVKASSNLGMNDVVAAWVGASFTGASVTADFVYVVSYNGQVGFAADGTTPLYQYSVIDKNGAETTAVYTTAYNASYINTYRELITNTAAGTVALKTDATYGDTVSGQLDGASVYSIDGVKYAKESSNEYVVTNVKVIDLRAAVAAGTAEAVTTVEEVAALSSVDATAIFTQDQLTLVKTAHTIIVK